jgi:hypothetical protein
MSICTSVRFGVASLIFAGICGWSSPFLFGGSSLPSNFVTWRQFEQQPDEDTPALPAARIEDVSAPTMMAWQRIALDDDSPVEDVLAELPYIMGGYALPERNGAIAPYLVMNELGNTEFSMSAYQDAWLAQLRRSDALLAGISSSRSSVPSEESMLSNVVHGPRSHDSEAELASPSVDTVTNTPAPIVIERISGTQTVQALSFTPTQAFGRTAPAAVSETPEPSTLFTFAVGAVLLAIPEVLRRRRAAQVAAARASR